MKKNPSRLTLVPFEEGDKLYVDLLYIVFSYFLNRVY